MNKNIIGICEALDAFTVDKLKESSNFKILIKVINAIEERNKPGMIYRFSWYDAKNITMNMKFDLSDGLTDAELDMLAGKIADVVHNITTALIDTLGFMSLDGVMKKLEGMSFTVE